jgi:tellurite resistance protein TerC
MQAWLWAGFVAFVIVMMVLDLKVVGARYKIVPVKIALAWTGVCVLLALAFTPFLKHIYDTHLWGIGSTSGHDGIAMTGRTAVTLFLEGWLLEYSLSIDNLFVFAVIFRYFRVPAELQHRALAWGIIAALILRGVMIGAGSWLFSNFDWMLYVAGLFLLWTAWNMVMGKNEDFDPEKHWAARLAKKVFPFEPRFHGDKFFVRAPVYDGGGRGVLSMTPLFLVLIVLNVVDVVFALDSIPAVFGITTDPFLVFTSNVFAILGLRSLYFAIAALMGKFDKLPYALAAILAFIGVKMLCEKPLEHYAQIHLPIWLSLVVIVVALTAGVIWSLASKQGPEHADTPAPVPPPSPPPA